MLHHDGRPTLMEGRDARSGGVLAHRVNGSGATPKVIAFHLPQFHRIAENDRWWGDGFTEWTNVRRARPLFAGHRQPRAPLGGRYYDLTDAGVREWQAETARAAGIHGFCFYHYWFRGKRLLERPVEAWIADGRPDFPFCLAWANESWTRTWSEGSPEVLVAQEYGGRADWDRHFDCLLRAFRDPRYIRVDGRPVFLIYRTASIADLAPMLARWRERAELAGLPGLHVVSMATIYGDDPRTQLVDARVEFEPMYTLAHGLPMAYSERVRRTRRWGWALRLLRRHAYPRRLTTHDYAYLWRLVRERPLPPGTYPGAFADWDNTPRRGERGLVLTGFDRDAFREGIAAQLAKARGAPQPLLFFNAWNEWAEGTYLEPDVEHGTFMLDTFAELLRAR